MSDNSFQQATNIQNNPTQVNSFQQAATQANSPETQGNQPSEVDGEWVAKLKESGFNFKSPDDIAKKAVNQDQFIDKLQKELAELREELNQGLNAKDLLEKANAQRQAESQQNSTEVKPEDLSELVKKELDNRSAAQKAQDNLMEADRRITELYGVGKGGDFLVAKSKELGISVDEMMETASRSPQAFYNMVGLGQKKEVQGTGVTKTSVNSDALAHTNPTKGYGTKAYFDEIRRTDKRKYFSSSVQKEIWKAMKNGTYET